MEHFGIICTILIITFIPALYSLFLNRRKTDLHLQKTEIYETKTAIWVYIVICLGVLLVFTIFSIGLASGTTDGYIWFGSFGVLFLCIVIISAKRSMSAYIKVDAKNIYWKYGRKEKIISLANIRNIYTSLGYIIIITDGKTETIPLFFRNPSDLLAIVKERI